MQSIPTYKSIPLKGIKEKKHKNHGMDIWHEKNRQSVESEV